MFCPRCGAAVAVSDKFCAGCGDPQLHLDQNGEVDSAMPDDPSLAYRAFLGPKNQAYYLSRFARFAEKGQADLSWHWPAFFAHFFWFAHRKMWALTAVYLAATTGTVVLLTFCGDSRFFGELYFLLSIALVLLPPLYANALYYNHCRKKISQAQSLYDDRQALLTALAARGGTVTSWLVVPLGVLAWYLAILPIPTYQTYKAANNVYEAAVYGGKATEAVSEYFSRYGDLASSLPPMGFHEPPPPAVKKIAINPKTGSITITLRGNMLIEGKHLQWQPRRDSRDQLEWKCLSKDLPQPYLQNFCESQE